MPRQTQRIQWLDTYRQFKITLQDRPNEKNHYRLDIRNDITVYGQYNNYKAPLSTHGIQI